MSYYAEILPHQEIVEFWTELFDECKSASSRSRKVNAGISDIRNWLNDIREAVNRGDAVGRGGWHHGKIYHDAHIRSIERELLFLMEYKNQLQHAKTYEVRLGSMV